jgi:translation initiation factor 2 subunit 2|tara:strand:+ start:259 stop:678 length:420 start_codon:yes stop_codon:yes gene_type:complete
MTKADYEELLKRIEKNISKKSDSNTRFELPIVDVTWEGKKTILRNFMDFPKAFRRDANIILQYLSKEFSVPAERVGDKVIFVGRRDPEDFKRLFEIYLKDYIECPTCISPDTKVEKEHRISFLICEACGAKSTIKGKYV